MRYRRDDVVERALVVLDTWGLADLTMRRLGAELGVQPSALYHHFASKQLLLAAVADEILARGSGAGSGVRGGLGEWDERVIAVCAGLREAMLAYRDGAEVVATVHAFGLGARAPYDGLLAALSDAGLPADLVRPGARTLLHFVLGHTADEQTHLQADSAGALPPGQERGADAVLAGGEERLGSRDFELGLGLVLDGLRSRLSTAHPR